MRFVAKCSATEVSQSLKMQGTWWLKMGSKDRRHIHECNRLGDGIVTVETALKKISSTVVVVVYIEHLYDPSLGLDPQKRSELLEQEF